MTTEEAFEVQLKIEGLTELLDNWMEESEARAKQGIRDCPILEGFDITDYTIGTWDSETHTVGDLAVRAILSNFAPEDEIGYTCYITIPVGVVDAGQESQYIVENAHSFRFEEDGQ